MKYLQVTEWYIVGSMTLSSAWVAVLAAFFLTWIVLWKLYDKQMREILVDVAFTFIIVWKLSVILTDFSMVIKFPLSILYFNGGKTGVILGTLFASFKLYVSLKKRNFLLQDIQAVLVGYISIQTSYQILQVLLNEGLWWQEAITTISFSIYVVFVSFCLPKMEKVNQFISIAFVFMHIIVAVLQPNGFFQTPLFVTVFFAFFINFLLYKSERLKK
ncbi:hypothetical protein [Psychrobacillus vulpis]|uniref:Uncharacterized protein n=1 Tax=Psychrobacillus vulpis TaxID=2325572 RepID=A0A544TS30_9BACI|nr:hypothetical protein [Psychrobacillus vulpis]TQR20256.1 hypothetical protein FG384_08845 [Psychrobacillus vulpis]